MREYVSPTQHSADHICITGKNPRKMSWIQGFAMMKKEDKTDVPLLSPEEAQPVPLKMTMPCFS